MSVDDALRTGLVTIAAGKRPSGDEVAGAINAMMSGEAAPSLAAAFLAALRAQGETAEQVVAAAQVMRRHAETVSTSRSPLVDTCGTGGDGKSTFSISTAAALVSAGAGAAVAKHGNRAASGKFGGADTLEALGVAIELPAESVGRCLDEVGMAFLFARRLHPAMRHVGPIRSELGIRTIFNLLGPLTSPAGVKRQVVGVSSPEALDLVSDALVDLGVEHALVVHSRDGLDEISLAADNDAMEIRGGQRESMTFSASTLGLPSSSSDDFVAATLDESVAAVRAVIEGGGGPRADIVAANAGAALYVAGVAESLQEGVVQAHESMTSGAAAAVLERLVTVSQRESAGGDSR